MIQEQWLILERWLNLLPVDILIQDPELLIFKAWMHLIHSRDPEMISCIDRAEVLLPARSHLPAAKRYLLDHLDVMRARQHSMCAETEHCLFHVPRANENIPLDHKFQRILLSCFLAT